MIEKQAKLLEARGGIEPPNKGFADLCLTAWLPRLETTRVSIYGITGNITYDGYWCP